MKKAKDHSFIALWRESPENRLLEATTGGFSLPLNPLPSEPMSPQPLPQNHHDQIEIDHTPFLDPDLQDELLKLTADIERAIFARTGRMIRQLRVVLSENEVVIHGHANSYYYKQLAQHAAMSLLHGEQLYNDILVD